MGAKHRDPQNLLNRCMPIANDVQLGDLLQELIDKHNALLAKLDTDAGVSGTNFASTLSIDSVNDR